MPLFSRTLFSFLLFAISISARAQSLDLWHLSAPEDTGVQGLSVDKAYALLGARTLQPVLVAVIDDGVDVTHPAFEGRVWINTDEIAGNNLDDDLNGYIDDYHGWNFLGNAEGENISGVNLEITRLYRSYKAQYDSVSPDNLKGAVKDEYRKYLSYKSTYEAQLAEAKSNFEEWAQIAALYEGAFAYMAEKLGTDGVNLDDLANFSSTNAQDLEIRNFLVMAEMEGLREELSAAAEELQSVFKYHYNLDLDPWAMLHESQSEASGTSYGNNLVGAENPKHGTHVAGIIAADRNPASAVKGIASNAIILAIRTVPDGDERDKDVAKAIRYAVDQGARIINMSFGKSLSPNRPLVDAAIAYAEERNVLLVHAAGNDGTNTDKIMQYPSGGLRDGKKSRPNWISVGASGSKGDSTLLAEFSNYGRRSVDVLAPGVGIWSLAPDSSVAKFSGTSMAAPTISGMAAFLLGVYPNLSAPELKKLITASTSDFSSLKVNYEGGRAPLKKLVCHPGIPSVFRALQLADEQYGKP